jgi:hypothetical protein
MLAKGILWKELTHTITLDDSRFGKQVGFAIFTFQRHFKRQVCSVSTISLHEIKASAGKPFDLMIHHA